MSCDLEEEDIDVLYWFFQKHLLSPKASLHQDAVYARLSGKIRDPEAVIGKLRTQLYIGKHKTMCLYADAGRVIAVLQLHRESVLPTHLRRRNAKL